MSSFGGYGTPGSGAVVSTTETELFWGTDRIEPCIEANKGVGANWICVHPYARRSPARRSQSTLHDSTRVQA